MVGPRGAGVKVLERVSLADQDGGVPYVAARDLHRARIFDRKGRMVERADQDGKVFSRDRIGYRSLLAEDMG